MKRIIPAVMTACGLTLAGVSLAVLVSGCGGGAAMTPSIVAKPKEAATGGGGNGGGTAKTVAAATGNGSFKGVIKITGGVPKLPPKVRKGDATTKDAPVCAAQEVPDESIIAGADGGLKNVFVYLRSKPAGTVSAAASDAIKFDNKNCQFVPHCILVRTGQTIQITNSDAVLHNTHIYSTDASNQAASTGIKPNDSQGIPYSYNAAEKLPVRVGCDIHNWMNAYHLPLDHPFVSLTNDKGEFEIKNIPVGRHQIRIWHEKAGKLADEEIVVLPGKTVEKNYSYEAGRFNAFIGPKPKTINITALSR